MIIHLIFLENNNDVNIAVKKNLITMQTRRMYTKKLWSLSVVTAGAKTRLYKQ